VSRVLVPGTLAIDYVADYGGRFSQLPRHPGVNLSIQLDRIGRRFGGCAMNIAYGLHLLGQDAVPFVFVGDDYGEDYRNHLKSLGIDRGGITRRSGAGYSSHAFVFTDAGGNQFTGFFPGPARVSDFVQRLTDFVAERTPDYAVLAPDTTRAPDYIKREAAKLGPAAGEFAQRLFAGTQPWYRIRQGHKLLRLGERYTAKRLDAACRRARDVDLIEVNRLERILVQALEAETTPQLPIPLPPGRFARPGSVFALATGGRS